MPPPLGFVNIDDRSPSRVGHVCFISATVKVSSDMLGKTPLQERASNKRTIKTADTGGGKKIPGEVEHEEHDDHNTETKAFASVKVKHEIEEVVDLRRIHRRDNGCL